MDSDSNHNDSCFHLASYLSDKYRNSIPYDNNKNGTNLTGYLSTHGLLLTMCTTVACSLGFYANHIAASWINSRIGATHILPGAPGVGLLLDPTVTEINCLYPTDGATDIRDYSGCGPLQLDPKKGSKGASMYNFSSRSIYRNFMNNYKNLNFGIHTDWKGIDCMQFLNSDDDFMTWRFEDNSQNVSSQLFSSLLQEQIEAIMGHSVCTPLPSGDANILVYSGPEPWPLAAFQEVVELQVGFIENNKTKLPIWNEIVIGLPRQLQDVVQAVFYVDDDEDGYTLMKRRAFAYKKAKILGKKFVLKFKKSASVDADLLECDDNVHSIKELEMLPTSGYARAQESILSNFYHPLADFKQLTHTLGGIALSAAS